ncbi:MAG: YabP/YqfC family sporulation protein [Bacteroides sp.]|nr:YabP/YqfC family sporulation protein [Bacteroides sp.]
MNINELAIKFEDFKRTRNKHSDIQITDNTEIILDGCRRVIRYDENDVCLELPSIGLEIVGMQLKLHNFSVGGVIIEGFIHSVTFIDKEEL